MTAEAFAIAICFYQFFIVVAAYRLLQTSKLDNELTRESNAATMESNKAVIAEVRNHFPRWQDTPTEEMNI